MHAHVLYVEVLLLLGCIEIKRQIHSFLVDLFSIIISLLSLEDLS